MSKHHVLVVDDNPEIRGLILTTLGSTFYTLGEASSGQQALEYLNANDYPDLIILDLAMPDLSGLEVLEWIKNDPETAYIEVIVLSGKSEPEIRARTLALGARDIITKPFSPLELLQKVEALFN